MENQVFTVKKISDTGSVEITGTLKALRDIFANDLGYSKYWHKATRCFISFMVDVNRAYADENRFEYVTHSYC